MVVHFCYSGWLQIVPSCGPHIFFLTCAVIYRLHIEASLFLCKPCDTCGSFALVFVTEISDHYITQLSTLTTLTSHANLTAVIINLCVHIFTVSQY